MWNPLRTREGEDTPNMGQAGTLALCGLVLAISGCAGWATTFANTFTLLQIVSWFLAAVFFVGVLAILGAFGLSIIVFFRFLGSVSRK